MVDLCILHAALEQDDNPLDADFGQPQGDRSIAGGISNFIVTVSGGESASDISGLRVNVKVTYILLDIIEFNSRWVSD